MHYSQSFTKNIIIIIIIITLIIMALLLLLLLLFLLLLLTTLLKYSNHHLSPIITLIKILMHLIPFLTFNVSSMSFRCLFDSSTSFFVLKKEKAKMNLFSY